MVFTRPIRCARASTPACEKRARRGPGPAAQGRCVCFAYPAFRFAQSGMNPRPTTFVSSAIRALGNVPGYYLSSFAGLGYCGRELVVFLGGVRKGNRHPALWPGVSFLLCRGDAIRKPAGLSRGGPAAQGSGVFLSLPTLFGFAVLAFRVGSIISRLSALVHRGCNRGLFVLQSSQ